MVGRRGSGTERPGWDGDGKRGSLRGPEWASSSAAPDQRMVINSAAAVVQVMVIGLTFLVLYRFVRDRLGAEQFGVWALVLATTSVGSVANLGLAASVTKFVSQHLARGDRARVGELIQTAVLSVAMLLALALVLLHPLLAELLGVLVQPPEQLPAALSILHYALLAFWLTSVAGVALAGLDGLHRIDLRGALLSLTAVAYLGLAFLLVPARGLVGLAGAQVLQAALLATASWIALRRQTPRLPWIPYRWRWPALREMLGYSVSFQAISLAQLFLEPMIKALTSRFGGVATLANLEFANRMVFQLRALVVAAQQALVPAVAHLNERDPLRIRSLYGEAYRLVGFLIAAMLPLVVTLTPLISRAWIGHHEPQFMAFAVVLAVAWLLNLASNPAYFANMGTGQLGWNVVGHVVTGAVAGGLGVLLGWRFGGGGVVTAFALAILAGSLVVSISYRRARGIRWLELVEPQTASLGVAGLIGALLALGLYHRLDSSWGPVELGFLTAGVHGAAIAVPLWRHPARRGICHKVRAAWRSAGEGGSLA